MLTKNELQSLWKSKNFKPVKRFGQNFLIDKNIQQKIIHSLNINSDDTVLEIGPGFGEMTFDIAKLAKNVIAVEKDKKIVSILKESLSLPKNIKLIEEDFLKCDIKKLLDGKKAIICGNLPYYITSPIIEKILNNLTFIKDIYFVMQKEVADRICAKPGSKEIGRSSLFVQYHTEPQVVLTVKKDSFFPAPKVESVLLQFKPLSKKSVEVKNEKFLFEIIKKSYMKRRKTIANSLVAEHIKKDVLIRFLESINIDPQSRPEILSLKDFAKIANILSK